MRILVFGEYLFAGAWRSEAWVAQACAALAARGHEVTLACDGGKDPAGFVPCRVIVRRPLRTWRATSPVAFSRWARAVAASTAHDASLSFTPLARADATLPLGGPLATLSLMVGLMNPIAVGLELLHQPWLPAAIAMEASLARSGSDVRLRIGLSRDGDWAAAVGYASRLPWVGDSVRAQRVARSRAREILGISPRRPVLLLSSVHPKRPGLEPMLHALADARAEARPALAPLALVVGRNGYSVHASAARAGCADALRILSATDRMADALDACDLVVAPAGTPPAEGTGRLIADALRRGRPVLADRDSTGAELLTPGPENGYANPGLIVERRTSAAWHHALRGALNPDWLDAATHAAIDAGRSLSLDSFAERLEGVLRRSAERRNAVSPP